MLDDDIIEYFRNEAEAKGIGYQMMIILRSGPRIAAGGFGFTRIYP